MGGHSTRQERIETKRNDISFAAYVLFKPKKKEYKAVGDRRKDQIESTKEEGDYVLVRASAREFGWKYSHFLSAVDRSVRLASDGSNQVRESYRRADNRLSIADIALSLHREGYDLRGNGPKQYPLLHRPMP